VRRRIGRSADDLTSRMLTPPEAAALQLPQGVPVIGALRTVSGAGDVPVEVQDTAPGDRHEFRFEVSMDGDGRPGRR
jgi:DNA-binding GntR family transcriptional regulator